MPYSLLGLDPNVLNIGELYTQFLQDMGADIKMIMWKSSCHVGLYKSDPIQYGIAVDQLLAHATSVFSSRIKKLGERNGLDDMHNDISHLIRDLQNAAADSNGSFRGVEGGPNDHSFLPCSKC